MKKLLKNFIYFLIRQIEKVEYKNTNFDENTSKIINSIKLNRVYAETDYGFAPVSEINLTIPYQKYEIELENGLKLESADNHLVFDENHTLYQISQLELDQKLTTRKGSSKVTKIIHSNQKICMFDLSIETDEHSYYTNDILSHNTVSTSIFMLWTVLFNNDKNIMIVANKSDTVKEIVKKIKDIYVNLPYYMKVGVRNWNEKNLSFDNGSAIHTQARSKEPAIGFTIDLLYIDEFAKIPNNIIRDYYGSAFPTVSNVENSKVIITSTPEGFNLFWEILLGAEKDPWDPLWNGYRAMRVYWWQLKGRRDVKLMFDDKRLKRLNLKLNPIIAHLKKEYNFSIYEKDQSGLLHHCIRYDKDNPSTSLEFVRTIRYNNIPIIELCKVTNWQEEQTLGIGGADKFKQEYDLQFLTDNQLIFDSATIESIKEETVDFDVIEIPSLQNNEYFLNHLKMIKDRPDLFDLQQAKNYKIVISIDLSDGLGNDYSTLNIFRLMPRTIEDIEKNRGNFVTLYDFFKLEQIGIWRSNVFSVDEVAHVLYLIVYDLFNSENVKCVLEMNRGFGDLILSRLPHTFNDKNNYSSSIFFRYRHRETDKIFQIGLKLTRGETSSAKYILIKEYQTAVKRGSLVMHDEMSIREISTFTKHETRMGNITYKAESGNDDCVMTMVNLSSVFNLPTYKDMIDNYIQFSLTSEYKKMIFEFTDTSDLTTNLEGYGSSYKKIYKGGNEYTPAIPSIKNNKAPWIKNLDNWWK